MATDPDREIDPELVDRLLEEAGDRELVGEGGLLSQLTKQVLEPALDTDLTDHLVYERSDPDGRGIRQLAQRNHAPVHTDIGTVGLDVPRDRNASFEPRIVLKGAQRLEGSTTASSRCTHVA